MNSLILSKTGDVPLFPLRPDRAAERAWDALSPVALPRPPRGALVRAGADHPGQFGVDQGLVQVLGGDADAFGDVGVLQCLQQVDQGRLVQGHRVDSFGEVLGGFSHRASRDGPSTSVNDISARDSSYTTSWHVTRLSDACRNSTR